MRSLFGSGIEEENQSRSRLRKRLWTVWIRNARSVNAFLDRNPLFASNQQGDFPLRKSEECVECLLEVLSEIEYFLYLIDKHEIEDKNLLDYYRPKVQNIIDFVLDLCGKVKPDPGTGPVLTLEEVEPEIAR